MDIIIGARSATPAEGKRPARAANPGRVVRVPEPKGAAALAMYDEAIHALASSGALRVLIEGDGEVADTAQAAALLAGVPGIRPMLARHLAGATIEGAPLTAESFGPGQYMDLFMLALLFWNGAGFLGDTGGSPTASPGPTSPTGTT